MENKNLPPTIKSIIDAHDFWNWIVDNQISGMQGYDIIYGIGCPKLGIAAYPHTHFNFDIDWIFENRRICNDWISLVQTDADFRRRLGLKD